MEQVEPESLSRHAAELYHDARLMPMLRQLVRTSCGLADAIGGSISVVDADAGRYTKIAEVGTACRLGQTFPLSEGVTGRVLTRREPVVLGTYREIGSGHLAVDHPAAKGAVVAIPIWWRGDIVAVNVIFAGAARPFTMSEVDHLELVTQVIGPGLVSALGREMPANRSGRPTCPEAAVATRQPSGSVNEVLLGLVDLAQRSPMARGAADGLQVRVIDDSDRPRLLIREDGPSVGGGSAERWHELVDAQDGAVCLRPATTDADAPASPATSGDEHPATPFSTREREVANLLARGLSDRAAAEQLCLSSKTVEKHVSAILRKTGTGSRTAAVVACIQHGWL
ncbi:MAG: LuxR C-terminal-related transcriptional regulator [Nocardioidaceae bacterium]